MRYRSYVYDNETGFYYIQGRYYDPTTCRFINAGAAPEFVEVTGSYDKDSPNCYAFAIGSDTNEQPGVESGREVSDWSDVEDVGASVVLDLEAKGFSVREVLGPNSPVNDNEFKIVLRVGTSPDPCLLAYKGQEIYDYHFMVQTSSGCWAEKHGIAGTSILHENGHSPDRLSWTLHDHDYYDSRIIYYAIGK